MSKSFASFLAVLAGLVLTTNCAVHVAQSNLKLLKTNTSLTEISPETSYRLKQEASELFFLSERIGWVVSNGSLYGTTDGGNGWVRLYGTDPTYSFEVLFVTEREGWATINQWSGRHAHLVMRTKDGGRTWEKLLNLESPIYKIAFVNDRIGFVRDRWELIRRTSDAGKRWTEMGFAEAKDALSLFEGLQYFFFLTPKEGWGYGSSIWHTSDGAETWTEVIPDQKIKGMLESAAFVDDKHGWIVGKGRQVWRMTDGKTWERATNIPPAQGPPEEITKQLPSDLYSVSFVNAEDGWVAANDKTVLHSSDGGANWEIISRWSSNIRALRFLSKTEGWAIDVEGHLLHTLDGGRSWNVRTLP